MMKLKELRNAKNLTQIDIAGVIGKQPQWISLYENDLDLPDMEKAITLENYFGGVHINWKETVSENDKAVLIQSINILLERYPLKMTSEFLARVFRREPKAIQMIQNAAEAALSMSNDDENILMIPNN